MTTREENYEPGVDRGGGSVIPIASSFPVARFENLTIIESASQNPHPCIFSSLKVFCGPLEGDRRYNRVTTRAAEPRPEKAKRWTMQPFRACT